MAELAGATARIKILAGSVAMAGAGAPTGAYIEGVDSHSLQKMCDLFEISAFGDTYKSRIAGLKDTTFTISGNVYVGDTNGQDVIIPGNTVMIGVYPSGPSVAGTQVNAIVENFETQADVTGKQTFSASFSGIAAPVALPLIS